MSKLSDNFTLEEFIKSDKAKALKIKNTPTEQNIQTMKHTCEYLLEPLKKLLANYFNKEIYICLTSGFRCVKLNSALCGAKNSQHLTGEAVDIYCFYLFKNRKIVMSYVQLYEAIKDLVSKRLLSVDQCIQEKSGNSTWVHVSYSAWGKTRNRNEFLKYDGKKYTKDIL